jgi:hypothetical protein
MSTTTTARTAGLVDRSGRRRLHLLGGQRCRQRLWLGADEFNARCRRGNRDRTAAADVEAGRESARSIWRRANFLMALMKEATTGLRLQARRAVATGSSRIPRAVCGFVGHGPSPADGAAISYLVTLTKRASKRPPIMSGHRQNAVANAWTPQASSRQVTDAALRRPAGWSKPTTGGSTKSMTPKRTARGSATSSASACLAMSR